MPQTRAAYTPQRGQAAYPYYYEDDDDDCYDLRSTTYFAESYVVTEDNEHEFFRTIHGREFNTLQPFYMLPADKDELKRYEYFHNMMHLVMGYKNYVGPVHHVLTSPTMRKKRILDIGTGSGIWAIEMADEFTNSVVFGVDIVPVQPRLVPPNCNFEVFDAQRLPFPNQYFEVVHARNVHIGIRNYPLLLHEIARVLRPGGVIVVAEPEIGAFNEYKEPIPLGSRGGLPGWTTFWGEYRRCLAGHGVDTSVPTRLRSLLAELGAFDSITPMEAAIPVGFWPKETESEIGLLAVGQYAWMENDYFLPATRPFFLSCGMSEGRADTLIQNAQHDLYYPAVRPYGLMRLVHARKLSSWVPDERYL